MVEDHIGRKFLGDVDEFGETVADAIDHGDRVGVAALFQDRHVDRGLAIDADYVGLDLVAVLGLGNIGNADRGLAHHLDRQVVDIRNRGQLAVGVEVVVQIANPRIAGRKDQIGHVECADDVHQAQLVRFQLEGVRVDHDLPVLAAKRLGHAGSGNTADLVADLVLGQVPQLGLG